MDNYNTKELYDVVLKTTCNMRINGIPYNKGEVLFRFKNLTLNLQEAKSRRTARGGYGNEHLIFWENTTQANITVVQGVISPQGMALLSNAQLLKEKEEDFLLSQTETLTTSYKGEINLKHNPIGKMYLYSTTSPKKQLIENLDGSTNTISTHFTNEDILVDYQFNYAAERSTMVVGSRLIEGFLSLEGRMRQKDDLDGHEKTGIIQIPKIKLMSDLSINAGQYASPMVNSFKMMGCPVGEKDQQYVCKIIFLNEDIDSDF